MPNLASKMPDSASKLPDPDFRRPDSSSKRSDSASKRSDPALGKPDPALGRPDPDSRSPDRASRRTKQNLLVFRRGSTDVQIPPLFYKTSSPFGAEALLTSKATIEKSLSRARVPQTISCLWATGFLVLQSTVCWSVHWSIGPSVHRSGTPSLIDVIRST